MAYSELIKDYERIRDYMRQFYVYGFKSREEYDAKSARSYDNERRRMESWLGEYMSFHQDAGGKHVFLSVDSREIRHNPLYKSFKAKSFTDKDITLHFYMIDILSDGKALTLNEIVALIVKDYLSHFSAQYSFDSSTVRKKLKEYEDLGILVREKEGRQVRYRLAKNQVNLPSWENALSFFSEENPLGVVGSFLLDRLEDQPDFFGFKHHYVLHALDSQILCSLLMLMKEHRAVELTIQPPRGAAPRQRTVYPLKIYVSTQTGRQYLLAYHYEAKHLLFQRIDAIRIVTPGNYDAKHAIYQSNYQKFQKHLWGVSIGAERTIEHIEMTIRVGKGEDYIAQRLEREKRQGSVTQIDGNTFCFTADVYDALELLPWIRTFIGRITELTCSNQSVLDTFHADFQEMIRMYGGDSNAV